LLGCAGVGGMSATVVVSVDQVVVVSAQILAAVRAELGRWLAAPFLMLLELVRAPESADVADFYLLARLQCRIQNDFHSGRRFNDYRLCCLGVGASTRLRLRVRLRSCTGFGF